MLNDTQGSIFYTVQTIRKFRTLLSKLGTDRPSKKKHQQGSLVEEISANSISSAQPSSTVLVWREVVVVLSSSSSFSSAWLINDNCVYDSGRRCRGRHDREGLCRMASSMPLMAKTKIMSINT
mmetsp:Transcript_10621/g.29287  ORF Transcript_10621/g.29287 Transcript_10621/m.29287 type:complete len:123 (+) Transcript_10621:1302-1670(+)